MRKVALLYNPTSGSRRRSRLADVALAATVFGKHGVEAVPLATEGPRTAGKQALEAIGAGADAIICCGGDGTIHDAIQPLVDAGVRTPIGVIPMGTGNGLAADLQIARDPAAAAWELLRCEPRRVPVGRVEWLQGGSKPRYFLISAGVGADAEMLYRLPVETKAKHGLTAYYLHAVRLFWTHRFFPLEVEYREPGSEQTRKEIVAQVLAGRIERFGGLVSRLTPGGSLERADMRVVLFRKPTRLPILLHATSAVLRQCWEIPHVSLVTATEVICRPVTAGTELPRAWSRDKLATRVYAQADGELLAGPPVRLSMVPDALTLLMPPRISN